MQYLIALTPSEYNLLLHGQYYHKTNLQANTKSPVFYYWLLTRSKNFVYRLSFHELLEFYPLWNIALAEYLGPKINWTQNLQYDMHKDGETGRESVISIWQNMQTVPRTYNTTFTKVGRKGRRWQGTYKKMRAHDITGFYCLNFSWGGGFAHAKRRRKYFWKGLGRYLFKDLTAGLI